MAKQDKAPEQQYMESLVGSLTDWDDPEARLAQAFKLDEFILFGQRIVPLDPKANLPPRLEVLIRLREEEEHLMPPGAFIPVLEHCDMMPALDRWVVEHAIQWWQSKGGQAPALNVNLSVETLIDPSFPVFVQRQMRKAAMPGDVLYFEVEAVDVVTYPQKSRSAADKLRAAGCRIAIAGFGRDLVSFDALKEVSAGMIKVDGGLVMEIHRDPVALAKIKSIQGVCAKVGIQTVAEFVEQQETIEKLRAIGFNYAQGYGVARPEPLN
ncbi:MAG: hypothetical protein A3I02_07655 [Betaproteobacteria bacterium RIFCSPLOWO2_02_FULL_67_26]|nr:MAG: hypothetical protein A3I02_07655 [Betaproteobacteria bacterium RIFCSPLOWO2_02_FULL_67_26]